MPIILHFHCPQGHDFYAEPPENGQVSCPKCGWLMHEKEGTEQAATTEKGSRPQTVTEEAEEEES